MSKDYIGDYQNKLQNWYNKASKKSYYRTAYENILKRKIGEGGEGYTEAYKDFLKKNYANSIRGQGQLAENKLKDLLAKRGMNNSSQEANAMIGIENQQGQQIANYNANLEAKDRMLRKQDLENALKTGISFDQMDKELLTTFYDKQMQFDMYRQNKDDQETQAFWSSLTKGAINLAELVMTSGASAIPQMIGGIPETPGFDTVPNPSSF